jgi:RimJ/RimL family protein N-acetyltransferase
MQPDLARWERHDTLPDRTHVLVRPLRPDDATLYPDFARDVTLDDMRLRFFAPLAELSDARIAELTHIDYDRAMAFIAIDEATAKMLGVVRLHLDDDRKAGEYAVIVRSALKGHGLGWLLMQRIIEYAKAIGLRRVHGQVLAENTMMLRMCTELGFRVTADPDGANIKRVTLNLGADTPR